MRLDTSALKFRIRLTIGPRMAARVAGCIQTRQRSEEGGFGLKRTRTRVRSTRSSRCCGAHSTGALGDDGIPRWKRWPVSGRQLRTGPLGCCLGHSRRSLRARTC
eukprot:590238-Rhodomonas_salina.3